ncbi:TPA: hypothetical protein QEM85_005450 [Pseudomonas putida]|uniref:hypothetical protein n=1 Tax=Pseudomonas TaxID=286 RepID=UPI00110CF27B|nr:MULTISPECIES: hypothetical protein [Pseudomonas]MDD1992041.1 hypothetical protein [Pseudomonas putida]HDS0921479.1 hypothetical protein [Pseudomonas putida]HDS0936720.1 hypothetical protein [Pseudomonas putida]HDS1786531.1 hypothetical protein [Pseudomonas putida]HDS3802000.1 hypothetical protein [Pseudomonas putida]
MSTEALTIIASILLACMAISVCVMIYLVCRFIEAIEKPLAKCKYIQSNRESFSAAGLVGKLMRTCLAANMLMIPGLFVRKGMADISDLESFPRSMKRVLLSSWVGLVVSTTLFFTFNWLLEVLK